MKEECGYKEQAKTIEETERRINMWNKQRKENTDIDWAWSIILL